MAKPPALTASSSGRAATRPAHFRRDFLEALAPAVAAYPEARLEVADDGLLLHPSRPPVAPRLVAVAARG